MHIIFLIANVGEVQFTRSIFEMFVYCGGKQNAQRFCGTLSVSEIYFRHSLQTERFFHFEVTEIFVPFWSQHLLNKDRTLRFVAILIRALNQGSESFNYYVRRNLILNEDVRSFGVLRDLFVVISGIYELLNLPTLYYGLEYCDECLNIWVITVKSWFFDRMWDAAFDSRLKILSYPSAVLGRIKRKATIVFHVEA